MELSSTVLSAAAESVRKSERAARAQTAVRHEDTRPGSASQTGDDLEKRTHHLETGSVLASLERDLQKHGVDISSLPLQRGRRGQRAGTSKESPATSDLLQMLLSDVSQPALEILHKVAKSHGENYPDSDVTALVEELSDSLRELSYYELLGELQQLVSSATDGDMQQHLEVLRSMCKMLPRCGKYPSMLQAARDECWQLAQHVLDSVRSDLQRCLRHIGWAEPPSRALSATSSDVQQIQDAARTLDECRNMIAEQGTWGKERMRSLQFERLLMADVVDRIETHFGAGGELADESRPHQMYKYAWELTSRCVEFVNTQLSSSVVSSLLWGESVMALNKIVAQRSEQLRESPHACLVTVQAAADFDAKLRPLSGGGQLTCMGAFFSEESLFRAMADADRQAAEHLIDECFDHDFWWAPSKAAVQLEVLEKECPYDDFAGRGAAGFATSAAYRSNGTTILGERVLLLLQEHRARLSSILDPVHRRRYFDKATSPLVQMFNQRCSDRNDATQQALESKLQQLAESGRMASGQTRGEQNVLVGISNSIDFIVSVLESWGEVDLVNNPFLDMADQKAAAPQSPSLLAALFSGSTAQQLDADPVMHMVGPMRTLNAISSSQSLRSMRSAGTRFLGDVLGLGATRNDDLDEENTPLAGEEAQKLQQAQGSHAQNDARLVASIGAPASRPASATDPRGQQSLASKDPTPFSCGNIFAEHIVQLTRLRETVSRGIRSGVFGTIVQDLDAYLELRKPADDPALLRWAVSRSLSMTPRSPHPSLQRVAGLLGSELQWLSTRLAQPTWAKVLDGIGRQLDDDIFGTIIVKGESKYTGFTSDGIEQLDCDVQLILRTLGTVTDAPESHMRLVLNCLKLASLEQGARRALYEELKKMHGEHAPQQFEHRWQDGENGSRGREFEHMHDMLSARGIETLHPQHAYELILHWSASMDYEL